MKGFIILVLTLLILPFVTADLYSDITPEEKATFDEILTPVMKIYNLVKYSATVIAALFIVFSAISFMMAGDDQKKRENAKKSIGYVIVGLIIIWVVPYAITFLVG